MRLIFWGFQCLLGWVPDYGKMKGHCHIAMQAAEVIEWIELIAATDDNKVCLFVTQLDKGYSGSTKAKVLITGNN